jgi:hypothetical protein
MSLRIGFSFSALALLLCVAPAHCLEGNSTSPSTSSLKAPITYLEAKRLALQVLSSNDSIKKVRSFGGEGWNEARISYDFYELQGCSMAIQSIGHHYLPDMAPFVNKGKPISVHAYIFLHVDVCRMTFSFDNFQ